MSFLGSRNILCLEMMLRNLCRTFLFLLTLWAQWTQRIKLKCQVSMIRFNILVSVVRFYEFLINPCFDYSAKLRFLSVTKLITIILFWKQCMSILFYLGAPEKSNKNIKVASLTSSTSVHSPIKGISKESLQRIAEIKQNLKSNKQIIYMIFLYRYKLRL